MIAIVCALSISLSGIIIWVFTSSYERQIYDRNKEKSTLVAREIQTFMEGAYAITESLSVEPSMLTMNTEIQTPLLADCVARNSYLELLYAQGMDGMQTARSSGTLGDRSTRWWFQQMMQDPKPFVSKSYYSVSTGMPCASIFFPMYEQGKMIGIFASDLKLDYLQSLIEEFSNVENGEFSFVIDGEGVVVAHPDSSQIEELYNYKNLTKTVSVKDESGNSIRGVDGNIMTEEQSISISNDYQQVIADVMGGGTGCHQMKNEGETYYVSYAPIVLKGESDSWSIVTLQRRDTALAMINRMILIAVFVAILGIAVAVFVIAVLARKLTQPIISITELVGNASDGDFTMRADESSENEIGVLSKDFNKMISKISKILVKITTFMGSAVQSSGYLKTIEENVESISKAVRDISEGTIAQRGDVDTVVARAGELEGKFQELQSKNVLLLQDAQNTILSGESGVQNVGELKRQNESTIKIMEEAYQKILALGDQSQKISNIVNTIGEISSETSLLSLNASIEAARAGEQGRGFAVVAESIGKLASDSTAATENIEGIIAEFCRDINNTVRNIETMKNGVYGQYQIVEKVQNTFDDFRRLAEKTKDSVSDIEGLVEEMHECDRSVVYAAEQIKGVSARTEDLTEKVVGSLEEQLAGIRYVAESIDDLSTVSEEMEQEMTKFKL